MYNSIQEALQVLDDLKRSPLERENAVHYLADKDDAKALERLVAALDDDVFGVRWAAATALANKGEKALPLLMSALTVQSGSSWMREGVYHALHYNTSPTVREKSIELMAALKGPGADMAAPAAAVRLMQALGS